MAILGRQIKTIHVAEPNDIEVPDPKEAPAFEVDMPSKTDAPTEKTTLASKLKSLVSR